MIISESPFSENFKSIKLRISVHLALKGYPNFQILIPIFKKVILGLRPKPSSDSEPPRFKVLLNFTHSFAFPITKSYINVQNKLNYYCFHLQAGDLE